MNAPTTSDLIFVLVNIVFIWSVLRLEKNLSAKLSQIEENTRRPQTILRQGDVKLATAYETARRTGIARDFGPDVPPPKS